MFSPKRLCWAVACLAIAAAGMVAGGRSTSDHPVTVLAEGTATSTTSTAPVATVRVPETVAPVSSSVTTTTLRSQQDRVVATALSDQPPSPAPPNSARYKGLECGGDLPPCWVLRRENPQGDIHVWNGGCHAPVGWSQLSPCGTSSASGWWQAVRRTWGGYAGYLNAADAPYAVQRAHAVALWDGGDGCSHWSAC